MRYFIIFFKWENEKQQASGNIVWSDTCFPNYRKVAEYIASETSISVNAVVITNLLEVNKKDYESWIE